MRLFLHGRLTTAMLRTKIEQAASQPIKTLLLSSWNFDEVDGEIVQLLIQYLESREPHGLEDITLHNCNGDEHCIVAAIMQSSPRCFTVRYDKQQTKLAASIATGMVRGSLGSRLCSFRLRGVTLTAPALESFRLALPQIQEFTSLSIRSHLTLAEIDRVHASILGRVNHDEADDIVYELIRLMQELPSLTSLDLENCNIPDPYLAAILRAVNKNNLATLKLRGNMAQQETMTQLTQWMISRKCPLKYLDLSWQRLVGSTTSNCSPFAIQMPYLASAIRSNTSLQTLLISENRLHHTEIKYLCRALVRNKTLQDLDLKDCRITGDGFRHIANNLNKFHLVRLNLNGQQKVQQGSKLKSLFFVPLSKNVYLLDLVLPCVESKSLAWLLEWNKAGRRVLVSQADFPLSLWPLLLERADQVGRNASSRDPVRHSASAIYYFIREKGFEAISKCRTNGSTRSLPMQEGIITTPLISPMRNMEATSTPSQISPDSTFEDSVLGTDATMTPLPSPIRNREDTSTPRQSSPDSAFEDSILDTGTPRDPTITPNLCHMERNSGDIELRLESLPLFDNRESTTQTNALFLRPRLSSSSFEKSYEESKPNPLLLRPRLVSSRKSSSIMSCEDLRSGTNCDLASYSRRPMAHSHAKDVQE